MKKAVTAGAVVVVGALAGPALASADSWDYTGSAVVGGSLTFTQVATGAQTSCDVEIAANLDNNGVAPLGAARGAVTSVGLSSCTTTLSGCSISQTVNGLPAITTQGANVTIAGLSVRIAYSGVGCPLSGGAVTFAGSFTGTHSAFGETEFVGATGVSSGIGPVVVDGFVAIADGPDWNRMVLLT